MFNANLRMLVNGVTVYQNDDKSMDVHFEINGDFTSSTIIILEPMFEYNIYTNNHLKYRQNTEDVL